MEIRTFFSGWRDIGDNYDFAVKRFAHLFATCPEKYQEEIFGHYFRGVDFETVKRLYEEKRWQKAEFS